MAKDEEGGGDRGASRSSSVSVVELPCPTCGRVERHRVVHVRAGPAGKGKPSSASPRPSRVSGRVEGIARCLHCRTPHPFVLEPRPRSRLSVIVSEGPVSSRHVISLPSGRTLTVGDPLTIAGRPVEVRRLEGPQERSLPRGKPADIVTVWTVPTDQAHVRISLLRGPRVVPLHLLLPPEQELRIGQVLTLGEEDVMIVGLRGRGKTWHAPGDSLRASETQRAYVRRAETPPGGSSAWTRSRVIPRS